MENNPDIKPKSKLLTYIVIVIVLAAIIGGGAVYYYFSTHKSSTTETISIAAPVYGSSKSTWVNFINNATKSWQAAHPNVKIKFVGPFGASSEGKYYTKLDLLTSSKSTAPTIMLEDMFYTATYQHEGILAPLNSYVNSSFFSNTYSSALGQMSINGTHYGLPAQVTDTLIYYNISLLQKAGVISSSNTTWQPTNWTQIINAAQKVNLTLSSKGVVPLNIYEGVRGDEASSFTGFEGLLYGTGYGLYNFTNHKWYGNNPGLNETLHFYKTAFSKGYATSALSSTPYVTVGQYMQEGKLAIGIDGSWMYGYQWAPGAQHPVTNFSKYVGIAKIPTINGGGNKFNTMVGGWGWAMYNNIPSSEKPAVASFMMALDNTSNQISLNEPGHTPLAGGLPAAKNAINNPNFSKLMPGASYLDTFYAKLLQYGSYRPPVSGYPTVSSALQTAMGSVVSGHKSVSSALSAYDSTLISSFGASHVQTLSGNSPSIQSSPTYYNYHNNKNTQTFLDGYFTNMSIFTYNYIFW